MLHGPHYSIHTILCYLPTSVPSERKHWQTPLTTKYAYVSVSRIFSTVHLAALLVVVIDCYDLFLEACSHMLVTVVCGFAREEDRWTAYVIGRTPLTPADVP